LIIGLITFADRVKHLQGEQSARSFARSVEISEGALRAILAGGKPTLDTLVALARGGGVNLEWLATGEGPMRPNSIALPVLNQTLSIPAEIAEDLALVRRLDIQASAGVGVLAVNGDENEEALQFIAFQASWLRARNINPTFCRVLTARGDSMEPTIRDGDTLLIDTSIDRAKDNTLYVIVFDGLVFVKRIHKRMSGAILLISDNPLYPDEEVRPEEVPGLHIAGRVIWYGRYI
jgi:phage repressor protein C with HTH and peptisase S24 domain